MMVCGDPVDASALAQLKNCADLVPRTVLCADHHKGYSVPIGGVMADPEQFAPATVGFDIACGMKAVRLDISADELRDNIGRIMDDVIGRVSFGIGRHNNVTVDADLFDSDLWRLSAVSPHKEMARRQLGTVGSGNHWANYFVDEQNRVWAGCHFGSRGLGHKTATWFLEALGAKDDMDSPPVMMQERSDLGSQYLQAIDLAGQYAYAGRDWVCDQLASIAGAAALEQVHSHHNFLWRETHGGKDYWVGRKGATPAFPGQRGLVGASMAEPSAIIEGVDSDMSQRLLYSTVHGAGRVMSRTEASGKRDRKTGELVMDAEGNPKKPGKVSDEMRQEWIDRAGVEVRGGGNDESPHVYKRLPEVLRHHEGTIKVVHWLTPVGVAMSPRGVFDPYKD